MPCSQQEYYVRHSADPAAALQEFESELLRPPATGAAGAGGAPATLMRTYDAGAALADRATALRSYCSSALGQPLFELIYSALRRRVVGGGDEQVFRQELQNRLGPSRMQYVHLIDQLIYFEDCYSRSS